MVEIIRQEGLPDHFTYFRFTRVDGEVHPQGCGTFATEYEAKNEFRAAAWGVMDIISALGYKKSDLESRGDFRIGFKTTAGRDVEYYFLFGEEGQKELDETLKREDEK